MKKSLSVLLLALGLVSAAVGTTTWQTQALPVYELSQTATPINVDGKLNDAVWAKAPASATFA